MTFKLVFDKPNFISKQEVNDVLYMNFIDSRMFRSKINGTMSRNPGGFSIGKQLADNSLNKGMESST